MPPPNKWKEMKVKRKENLLFNIPTWRWIYILQTHHCVARTHLAYKCFFFIIRSLFLVFPFVHFVSLTDWENHRLQSTYENFLITKLIVFECVNGFGSLFYIAFVDRDHDTLFRHLATIMITKVIS